MNHSRTFRSASHIQEGAIIIERTEEFLQNAQRLSEFIKGLPLSQPDNDQLIAFILQQVQDGERQAFVQGFRMGTKFEQYEAERKPKGTRS